MNDLLAAVRPWWPLAALVPSAIITAALITWLSGVMDLLTRERAEYEAILLARKAEARPTPPPAPAAVPPAPASTGQVCAYCGTGNQVGSNCTQCGGPLPVVVHA